ncbi:17026_t:CDS:2 [Gigaspora margarita]|uniref:17026_t:CDS:1 n=1 Tax=Gigaspora margarita TaxID=4874 RepID=A0ABN7UDJ9_GIGMA|nr:17026_t:CDS:2 [Gigaspora margarita]
MPSTITITCYVTDRQEVTTNKALTIVKASGVMRIRNSTSPLNVLLIGFYSQDDDTPDPTLATFSSEDVLLVSGKFRFVEDIDETGRKFPILKIVLHHVVQLLIDPSDLPAFPLLINMTAIVLEPPRIDHDHDDVTLVVETKDFMDQDHTSLTLECYHQKTAQHLTPITTSAKKGSTLFMNGQLLVDEDSFVVHLRGVNFCEYQKPTNAKNLTNLPWLHRLDETPTNDSSAEKSTRTIASRVKGGRRKKASSTTRSYINLKDRPKVTDFVKKALSQNDVPDLSAP